MAGQVDVVRLAQGAHAQEGGDAAAAGDGGLQAIDGARRQHVFKIIDVEAVFARRDVHARRTFAAQLREARPWPPPAWPKTRNSNYKLSGYCKIYF